jgi:site-specific DNA-methyltransferase (adenine-specific)
MGEMAPESVGVILCDPPYGLEFMENEWDTFQNAEVLDWGPTHDKWGRVPGAGAFASPRPRFRGKRNESLAPYQDWSLRWLREAHRILTPRGILKVFGGTRTFHRLISAMGEAGFEDLRMIAWVYGSGFPKNRDIGKEAARWEGWGTALKPSWEPILVGRKP